MSGSVWTKNNWNGVFLSFLFLFTLQNDFELIWNLGCLKIWIHLVKIFFLFDFCLVWKWLLLSHLGYSFSALVWQWHTESHLSSICLFLLVLAWAEWLHVTSALVPTSAIMFTRSCFNNANARARSFTRSLALVLGLDLGINSIITKNEAVQVNVTVRIYTQRTVEPSDISAYIFIRCISVALQFHIFAFSLTQSTSRYFLLMQSDTHTHVLRQKEA